MADRDDTTKASVQPGALAAQLAANVRRLRTRQGLSRLELARRAGVGAGLVALLEAARHSSRLATVEKIAAALGVEADELLIDLRGEEGEER